MLFVPVTAFGTLFWEGTWVAVLPSGPSVSPTCERTHETITQVISHEHDVCACVKHQSSTLSHKRRDYLLTFGWLARGQCTHAIRTHTHTHLDS